MKDLNSSEFLINWPLLLHGREEVFYTCRILYGGVFVNEYFWRILFLTCLDYIFCSWLSTLEKLSVKSIPFKREKKVLTSMNSGKKERSWISGSINCCYSYFASKRGMEDPQPHEIDSLILFVPWISLNSFIHFEGFQWLAMIVYLEILSLIL